MIIPSALLKPAVDAIYKCIKTYRARRLSKSAEIKIKEAIRELLLINPNEDKVEDALLSAKAAGFVSPQVVAAKRMLRSVRGKKKGGLVRKVAKKMERKKIMRKSVHSRRVSKTSK